MWNNTRLNRPYGRLRLQLNVFNIYAPNIEGLRLIAFISKPIIDPMSKPQTSRAKMREVNKGAFCSV